MKEIVIISGKGGTGKTSISAAFANLASKNKKIIIADSDVDAADLHLILKPNIKESHVFKSGHQALIDAKACNLCGKCQSLCRFEAVSRNKEGQYFINESCEGCKVCVEFCPVQAIGFPERTCGQWFVSDTRFGTFVHAQLDAQAENSGKLVSVVRKKAQQLAEEEKAELILIDGPPGIGCPVIASITGAFAVVAVTEPTISGVHDLERVAQLTKHFGIPLAVCVNKFDINEAITDQIAVFCKENSHFFLGRIPYDPGFVSAQIMGNSLVEMFSNETTNIIRRIWEVLCQKILL